MKTAFGCNDVKVMAFGGVAMYFNLLVTELGRGELQTIGRVKVRERQWSVKDLVKPWWWCVRFQEGGAKCVLGFSKTMRLSCIAGF